MARLAMALLLSVFAAPAAAAAQSTGADVVHLLDGGIVRGTIVEHRPGDHTTVLLITGETTTLTADLVERVELGVGPREVAAALSNPRRSAAPASAATSPETVAVRVRGVGRWRLSLHAVERSAMVELDATEGPGSMADYERLCDLPCELELEPNVYELGVATDDAPPRRPDHARFDIQDETRLLITYRSHSALRAGGWIMFVAGSLTSALLIGMSVVFGFGGVGLGLLVPGAVLFVFSFVHFLVNAFRNDHVDVTVEPATVRF